MAELERLIKAFEKADAAGNKSDAKMFAREIRRLQATEGAQGAETAKGIGKGLATGALADLPGGVVDLLTGSGKALPRSAQGFSPLPGRE